MKPRLLCALGVLLILVAPGLAVPPAGFTPKTGVVFIVEGIGGGDILGCVSQVAFHAAGVPHEIRNFTWTHGRGKLFKDLQDHRYLLKKAKMLSEEIERYRVENPGRPVYVVGKSGGAGLTLAAAELVPPESIERIVLLSAAVAPNYDLRRALRATCKQIVSFHSSGDYIVLGWGTSQFGTIDRYYGPAAGLVGFEIPEYLSDEDRKLYSRLVQIPWKPEMIVLGNLGNHLGTSMPGFLTKKVVPWLMPKSDQERQTWQEW